MKPKVAKGKIAPPVRIVFNPHNHIITDQLGPITKHRHGRYAHYCFSWDELLIDETDIEEFKVCECGKPNSRT